MAPGHGEEAAARERRLAIVAGELAAGVQATRPGWAGPARPPPRAGPAAPAPAARPGSARCAPARGRAGHSRARRASPAGVASRRGRPSRPTSSARRSSTSCASGAAARAGVRPPTRRAGDGGRRPVGGQGGEQRQGAPHVGRDDDLLVGIGCRSRRGLRRSSRRPSRGHRSSLAILGEDQSLVDNSIGCRRQAWRCLRHIRPCPGGPGVPQRRPLRRLRLQARGGIYASVEISWFSRNRRA